MVEARCPLRRRTLEGGERTVVLRSALHASEEHLVRVRVRAWVGGRVRVRVRVSHASEEHLVRVRVRVRVSHASEEHLVRVGVRVRVRVGVRVRG